MTIHEFGFSSATGVGQIAARAYFPESGRADTVLVIHHGMAEHQERYQGLIAFLAENGIAVYMHDMASHGKSCPNLEEAGYFGEKDGWKGLVQDFRTMVKTAKEENPGSRIIVMGHSMGSFVCREYTAEFPDDGFAGAVFMGTGGPNPAAQAGKVVGNLIARTQGQKHRSALMDKLAFGSYNKRCEGRTGFDWLTRDPAVVDRYIADPYCGFPFTVRGMVDLISVNCACNSAEWFEKVKKDLPILLISGEEDPVGDYGKGVRTVGEELKKTGHTRVTVKLYPGCRHEVLNETNRDEVMQDLLD